MKMYLVTIEVFYDFEQRVNHYLFDSEEKAIAFAKEKYEKDRAEEPEWEDEDYEQEVDLESGYWTNYLPGETYTNSIECSVKELDVQ